MALNLVTFQDKENLNTEQDVPRINKVVDDDINQLKSAINELIFPVGSIIYNASEDFDPNVSYGGTWEKIKGKMVIGYDEGDEDFNTLANTGGSKTHIQTVDEMPSHKHTYQRTGVTGNPGYTSVYGSAYTGDNITSNSTGGGQPMNIMNPYYVANIWIRTA